MVLQVQYASIFFGIILERRNFDIDMDDIKTELYKIGYTI